MRREDYDTEETVSQERVVPYDAEDQRLQGSASTSDTDSSTPSDWVDLPTATDPTTSPTEYNLPESGYSNKDDGDSDTGLLEGQTSSKPTPPSSASDGGTDPDKSTDCPSPDFPWPRAESKAKEDWEYQKASWKKSNTALDELMDMIGLEVVKRKFVQLNTLFGTANRQGLDFSGERLGTVFIGNPGTGKSRVAEIYANFLHILEAVPNDTLTTIAGTRLVADGVQGCVKLLDQMKKDGGVLVVEEAHQMIHSDAGGGGSVLDYLLSEVEKLKGKVVFLFAGYGKQMEAFCAHSPTFPNLIPTTINFPDYLDHELHLLLIHEMKSRFKGNVKVEGGYHGHFMRILARRIGRGRGRHAFGNARDVQNTVSRVHSRQADRLFRSMKDGTHNNDDDLVLTQEDLIGPPPSSAFTNSNAWNELKGMIGLNSVKDTIDALVHRLQLNYERELAEMPLVECSLNKLFLGNPGTGKTTVAKLYGQILADIGLLSNGEVVLKTPSDLIGDALGQSERNTKAILDSTKGKVLIIDEAYMLGGRGDNSTPSADPFRTAVIDTIVGEVQSTAVEDRCVLLLGYRDRMESMLNEANPALARRFPLASAFLFEDYSQDELRQILDRKLGKQGFRANDDARTAALEVLARSRNRTGFGNAGEVDILLDQAKVRQHRRLLASGGMSKETDLFLPSDIDPDFERGARSLLNIRDLFDDFVGSEALIQQLEGYQVVVRNMKALSKRLLEEKIKMPVKDPREVIPFTFLFCGPPGTGKTTTANRMGELFYDMGFLATKDVVECSATDLIGEYVGHTGPKTKRLFDSALGRVLFIDEAYKLADGPYGREAMIEMINNLTKEKYQNKLVIILAGYEDDINKLMSINPGLNSRFPVVITFNHLSVTHCIDLLVNCLKAHGLDTSLLQGSEHLKSSLESSFGKLSALPSWGNARDVQTLAKTIFLRVLGADSTALSLSAPEELVVEEINSMIEDRRKREVATPRPRDRKTSPDVPLRHGVHRTIMPPLPLTSARTSIDIKKTAGPDTAPRELQKTSPAIDIAQEKKRDGSTENGGGECLELGDGTSREVEQEPGVSEDVWDQLESDKKAARKRQADLNTSRNILALFAGEVARAKVVLSMAPADSELAERAKQRMRVAEGKHETQRKTLEEKEEEEQKEREIQELLRNKCPLGYEWIRQEQGYRCAGGTHTATFEQLRAGEIARNT